MEDNKKDYTVDQEQIARFAKALGHPARTSNRVDRYDDTSI